MYKQCGKCHLLYDVMTGRNCKCYKRDYKTYDDKRNKEHKSFYSSKDWNKVRDLCIKRCNYLDLYSYYFDGVIEVGETVHHIIPLKDDFNKKLDIDNLFYLTNRNHKLIHKIMNENEEKKKEIQKVLKRYNEKYKEVAGWGVLKK